MSLSENINSLIKEAMKSGDKARTTTLRAIKSELLLISTEKGSSGEISDEQELKMLQKMMKQRMDSAEIYHKQNRADLAEKEEKEAKIIEEFLPAQMSDEQLKEELSAIIQQSGASSPADMGKVMGAAMGKLQGKADGKRISGMVKELLTP